MFKNLGCHPAVCRKISGGAAWEECPRPATAIELANVNNKVDNIVTKVDNTAKELADVNTKVDNTETALANVNTKVENTGEQLANVNTKVDNTATKVDNVKGEVDKILIILKGRQPLKINYDYG